MTSKLSVGRYDIPVKAGSDRILYLRFKDGKGNLIDFTGTTLRFYAAWRTVVIEKTDSQLFTDVDGSPLPKSAGKVFLHITKIETREMPLNLQMPYSVEVTDTYGNELPVLEGFLNCDQGGDNVDGTQQ